MSVGIIKTEQGYLVNGKQVYRDSDNNWIAPIELSSIEKQQFNAHLNSL